MIMINNVVSIIGRPNVGKSTLFNRLIGKNKAMVSDFPGTTRDRNYAECFWAGKNFTLVDTGGFDPYPSNKLKALVKEQTLMAIEESNVLVFLLDGREGVTPIDREISDLLRKSNNKVIYVVNKIDSAKGEELVLAFYELGVEKLFPVSSVHGLGIGEVLDEIIKSINPDQEKDQEVESPLIKIAVVGRPNVGKSSIVNYFIGEDRVLVSEVPGTTVDSLDIVLEIEGEKYLFFDTAGIRKKSKINTKLEKGSISFSIKSLKKCSVAVLVIDASEGVTDQDLKIANLIHREGKGFILIANKWDLVQSALNNESQDFQASEELYLQSVEETDGIRSKKKYNNFIRTRLGNIDYANIIFTSAKSGFGMKGTLPLILQTYGEITKRIPTFELNTHLSSWVQKHHPPMHHGREVKIKYAHQIRTEPPCFQIFTNQPQGIAQHYVRYLEKKIREEFGFKGVPLRISFRK